MIPGVQAPTASAPQPPPCPSPLQPPSRCRCRWAAAQGKPSLCPAGWGTSHPDKEFDSSSPVVSEQGGGGSRQWAGRGPTRGWPRCGQAGQKDSPRAASDLRALPSPAGPGDPGDRGRRRPRESFRDHLDSSSETEILKQWKPAKPHLLRQAETQRWRQRDRDRDFKWVLRDRCGAQEKPQTGGQTIHAPWGCQPSGGAKNKSSYNADWRELRNGHHPSRVLGPSNLGTPIREGFREWTMAAASWLKFPGTQCT